MKAKLAGSMGASTRSHGLAVGEDSIQGDVAQPLTVVSARRGDEPLIQQFLLQAGWPVNSTDYLAQLEQPGYETSQRLLLKRGEEIVGHLRTSYRPSWIDGQRLLLSQFHELGVDFRVGEHGVCALFDVAQATSRAEGSWGIITAFPRHIPSPTRGFIDHASGTWRQVRPAALLAHLGEHHSDERERRRLLSEEPADTISVRVWRQVEQSPVRRLYDQTRQGVWGVRERDDEYWRWLTARRGFDRIYLAIHGDPDTGFHDPEERVVGYAVVRGADVIEWVIRSRSAGEALMRRVAREALEHDVVTVRWSPPLAPAEVAAQYEQFVDTCGVPVAAPFRWRIKVFHPLRLLDRLRPVFAQRARDAGLKAGTELGFDVDGHRFQLTIGARSIRLGKGKLGRSYLSMSGPDLVRLALGTASGEALCADGPVRASTQLASRCASALFPAMRWWLSSWDEMPSREL